MKSIDINYQKGIHYPVLDGIRGMAIILVLLVHLFRYYKWVSFGWMGVDLFFVLSGFLITGILLDTRLNSNYYKNFIVKRILRIFPLYYFFLILFFIVFPLFSIDELITNYAYLSQNQIWFWLYVQNWLFIYDPSYPEINIISHFWSLAIEEQFYIFWPAFVYFFSGKKLKVVCVVLLLISIIVRVYFYLNDASWIIIYESTITRLDGLAIGSLVAILIREEQGKIFLQKNTILIFLFSAGIIISIIVFTGNFYVNNPSLQTIGYSLIDIFFASVLIICLSSSSLNFVKKIFNIRILIFFGKYSYGIYVYHKPIYYFLETSAVFSDVNREALSVFGIVVSVLVAFISYKFLEYPFLKLKSKVI